MERHRLLAPIVVVVGACGGIQPAPATPGAVVAPMSASSPTGPASSAVALTTRSWGVVMVRPSSVQVVDPTSGAVLHSWTVPGCDTVVAVIPTAHADQIVVECGGGLGEPSDGYSLSGASGTPPRPLWKARTEDVLCADLKAGRVLRGLPDTSGFGGGEKFAWLDPATGTETKLPTVPSASPATAVCGPGVAATGARADGGGIHVVTIKTSGLADAPGVALGENQVPLLQAFDLAGTRLLLGVLDEQAPSYGIEVTDLISGQAAGLVRFSDSLGAATFTPTGRIVLWNRPTEASGHLLVRAIDPSEPTVMEKLGAGLPSDARDMMPSDDGSAGLVVAGDQNGIRFYFLDLSADSVISAAIGEGDPRAVVRLR